MRIRHFLVGAMALASAATAAKGSHTSAPAYRFVDLGTLPGDNGSNATGLNRYNHVAGASIYTYVDSQNVSHSVIRAFFWADANGNGQADPGEMVDLGALPGATGGPSASGLNDSDVVVGDESVNGADVGFIWNWGGDGQIRDMNTLLDPTNPANAGWHVDFARSINDAGQVAAMATYSDATGPVRRDGVLVDLNAGVLTDTGVTLQNFYGTPLNGAGQVLVNGSPASFWAAGQVYDISVNGSGFGIDDTGRIAGGLTVSGGSDAFVWTPDIPNGSTGTYVDCGALPAHNGGPDASAYGVQVVNGATTAVGMSWTGKYISGTFERLYHAIRWQPATGLQDLNSLCSVPSGVYLRNAPLINPSGIIAGQTSGSYGHAYELLPQ